jgi:hypothetical protein
MICQPCELGNHEECEHFIDPCDCPCQTAGTRLNLEIKWNPPTYADNPDYATDEKLMWADLRRKERREE